MIPGEPDLLVIGGLTVDRFHDGSAAPGGSVLHIARALAARGPRVAALTVAGPEPVAQAGLDELRRLTVHLECQVASSTATFVLRETDEGRRLTLATAGGRIVVPDTLPSAGATLLAQVADELAGADLTHLREDGTRAAILQGWLRDLDGEGGVAPRPLRSLPPSLTGSLGCFDLLVTSREDLAAEGSRPDELLDAMRRTFGDGPALVLTVGSAGAWADAAGERTHLPVPMRVEGASSVGAGDILAGLLLGSAWPRPATAGWVRTRLELAMREVAELLSGRLQQG